MTDFTYKVWQGKMFEDSMPKMWIAHCSNFHQIWAHGSTREEAIENIEKKIEERRDWESGNKMPYVKQWVESLIFDMGEPRSVEYEDNIATLTFDTVCKHVMLVHTDGSFDGTTFEVLHGEHLIKKGQINETPDWAHFEPNYWECPWCNAEDSLVNV